MKLFFILILIPFLGNAQDAIEEAYNKQYEANIKLEYINDVYIPADIADAMNQLNELSNEDGKKKFLEGDEDLVADRLIYGLGKWMTVNWNFYEGSRLSHNIKNYGVTHPDDMARFLIITYHRLLRNVPLELEQRGAEIKETRLKEQEKRNRLKREVINN